MLNKLTRIAALGGVCLFASGALPARAAGDEDPDKTRAELNAVNTDIEAQREKLREIEAEVASLKNDRAEINARLIATAERIKRYESAILQTENRLSIQQGRETELRKALAGQRGTLAVLLAALEKLGHRPPPAVIVSPDNALATVRSAMLLGAVVPDLRRETETLGRDLAELIKVKEDIAAERIRLADETDKLGDEQIRLTALLDAKTQESIVAEERMSSERKRADELAARAEDLQQLLAAIEAESARRAAAEAAKPKEPERSPQQALRDTGRLKPAVKFASAKGTLPLPAAGAIIREYGAPDTYGGTSDGLSIATRARAQVTAPSDGWIAYSGPFRSYGQLLIIDAGDGYHIVMAGLESVNAEVGQFVLAGEPVGQMGTLALASAVTPTGGPIQPVLYVEFRKDGRAINPQPWWADNPNGVEG
ncbi:MAG: peptidoglycan DD-metalloendopeptidase family protein [Rhodobiaceae bacterium]|nr:peptidoglycan DD-metalloendopeptidase family protein [Rhodobiaceae bacterium]MCC0049214.1 peptidoglycan DD-metalloendopeptidase family protein [Rhodobiaceae bacterium]